MNFTAIQIHRLLLKGFRCFDEADIRLSPRFTLIAGSSGAGKTVVLDAVATALAALLRTLGFDSRAAREHDWSEDSDEPKLTAFGYLAGEELTWDVSPEAVSLAEPHTAKRALTAGSGVGRRTLPVLAYFSPTAAASTRVESRYHGTLEPTVGISPPLAPDASPGTRTAVEAALSEMLANGEGVHLEDRDGELWLDLGPEAESVRWADLNGSRRWVGGIAATLAATSVAINQHLGSDAPARTPGIVLIEEIETHLHPAWQRYLIEDLQRVFPLIQFVATTNSPFIIQSLHDGDLLNLDDRPGSNYPDLSIEDIAEQVMGIHMPQRSKRLQDMFKAAKESLRIISASDGADSQTKAAMKARLDELSRPFSDNQAFQAVLEMQRIEAGLASGDDEDE